MTATLTARNASRTGVRQPRILTAEIENPYEPTNADEPPVDTDDSSELDDVDGASIDDANWDVFVADDDEFDPLPDAGDFWMGE